MVFFKDIELKDKLLIDQYFQARPYENSEFTFTNLFIWRHSYHFQYAIIQDHLCIMGKYRNLYPFIFSPLSLETENYELVFPILEEHLSGNGWPVILKSVSEKHKSEMEALIPNNILFREDRSNHDYVYLTRDLIELRGKNFRQKRNHVNKFLKSYAFAYEEMSEANLQECLRTEQLWAAKRNGDKSVLEEEQAIREVMNHFQELQVTGGVLRVHDKVQAFAIGELQNPDMAVVHFEKANIEYNGSFNIINQAFTQNKWSHVTYINREEDMGIAGLRKAKESYHPVKMVKKYTGFYSGKEGKP